MLKIAWKYFLNFRCWSCKNISQSVLWLYHVLAA